MLHLVHSNGITANSKQDAVCTFSGTTRQLVKVCRHHEGQTLVDDVVTKHVPPHIGLFYCLGGIVFMALVAQFTSGLVLTFYFTPTVDDAYLSVEPLELSRHSGQLFGSVHRWASNLMLLAILLHLSRVYLTGGLKKPRELTWVSGALLSFLALSFGVSGYSLPWDEIGFWALQVVSAVPETTDDFLPGVGSSIVCPIRGGFSIGQETLNRAFTAHTLTLPAGAAIVSLLHFLLIRKQSVSGPLWRCWRCHVVNGWQDILNRADLGMEVMHERNAHNFPLDLA